MTALLKRKLFTANEYLLLEKNADYRSQYIRGEIFAMAGASRRHNIISGNTYASLHVQLRRKTCEVYQSDMRVKISDEFYTYPDVAVVCGGVQIERRGGSENLLNPTVLIEVLSRSTAKFDRTEKAEAYRPLRSVHEYIIVWQERIRIEQFTRQGNGKWILTELIGRENVLMLDSIGCRLDLADVYDRVDFNEVEIEE